MTSAQVCFIGNENEYKDNETKEVNDYNVLELRYIDMHYSLISKTSFEVTNVHSEMIYVYMQ